MEATAKTMEFNPAGFSPDARCAMGMIAVRGLQLPQDFKFIDARIRRRPVEKFFDIPVPLGEPRTTMVTARFFQIVGEENRPFLRALLDNSSGPYFFAPAHFHWLVEYLTEALTDVRARIRDAYDVAVALRRPKASSANTGYEKLELQRRQLAGIVRELCEVNGESSPEVASEYFFPDDKYAAHPEVGALIEGCFNALGNALVRFASTSSSASGAPILRAGNEIVGRQFLDCAGEWRGILEPGNVAFRYPWVYENTRRLAQLGLSDLDARRGADDGARSFAVEGRNALRERLSRILELVETLMQRNEERESRSNLHFR